jgi:hypothetical protein
MSYRATRDLK